jgi:hypothetical protein
MTTTPTGMEPDMTTTPTRKESDMTTTTTTGPRPATRGSMDPLRRTALLTGVFFLITYLTAIAAKFYFYAPMFEQDNYVLGAGRDNLLLWGAFNEVVLVAANIATAVVLFPVLRRQSEALALGFVTTRVMESVFISVGILSVLTIVTLRQDLSGATGAEGAALATVGTALVTLQQWTFNLGPGVVVGLGNGLILGYLMYRSRLVPRGMAVLGLVGGPLLLLSGTAVLLGVIEAGRSWQLISTIPEFFWELSLGVYLIVKGFRPCPITAGMTSTKGRLAYENAPE